MSISKLIFFSLYFIGLSSISWSSQSEELGERAYRRFLRGEISAAQSDFEKALKIARSDQDPYATWNALINLGWFFDQRGHHLKALEYSNQALDISRNEIPNIGALGKLRFLFTYGFSPILDSTYVEGRSLSWIAWAYASMGRYEAAKALYERAVELGAPNGRIRHVMVWGLSTQELGWLMYKMGDYEAGKTKVLTAYDLASANGIDIGIAECGAILAEMELLSGNLTSALSFAEKAESAARRSDVTPFNIGSSLLIKARILSAMAQSDAKLKDAALQKVLELEKYALGHDLTKIYAYALVIHAQLLDGSDVASREPLLQKALELLTPGESELSGLFSSEYGRELAQLDGRSDELAKFYVERGIRLSNEMLRVVDKAQLTGNLASIEMKDGKLKAYLTSLKSSADAAIEAGQLPLAFEKSDQLSRELERSGYRRLALEWTERSYNEVNKLLTAATTGQAKQSYARQKIDVNARLLRLRLELQPPRPGIS